MKIAVFGGSFDPVHFGHLRVVRGIVESGYDKVIVVPAFVSPFKSTSGTANVEHRDEMLRRAFMDFLFDEDVDLRAIADFIRAGNLIISDVEIKRQGISYTYETIKWLKKEYPDAIFDFVIGWDCVLSLDGWKNFDKLKDLTGFLAVKRGQMNICQSGTIDRSSLTYVHLTIKIEELKSKGANIQVVDFEAPDISSSYVRVLNAFGRIAEAVPQSVAEYIRENKLYREYGYIAKRHAESGLSKERTEHSLRVAEESINLAKINGVNINDAITAALLHDIAKNVEWSEMADSQYLSVEDTELIDKLPESCRHAWIGAWAVEKIMGLSTEIAGAVRLHTTGAPNMSTLAKIIYLADYIEKGRRLKYLQSVRKIVYNDLDEGMRVVLGLMLGYLEKKGGTICDLTKEAYKYYSENKA